MDRTARLYLCAHCREQVLLCSECDHGQRYCSRACSNMSRRERRRETVRRYQRSERGRRNHVARTASWRARRRAQRQASAGGEIPVVTHMGRHPTSVDALLPACETPSTCDFSVLTESAGDTALASLEVAPVAALVCRRCKRAVRPEVRLDFLHVSAIRWRNHHDHPC